MSDEKRSHYIPEHRKAEIVENTDLSWKAYQNIPTEQQRQEFVKQLLGNLENKGFTINDVDLNDVDYNTFYNIYSDKSTIEGVRKTEQIEAEKKADEEAIVADAFSDTDSGTNSQSAKDVCEVCDNNKLWCLCHVEITSPLRKEKYFWKVGSVGELANHPLILGVHGDAYAPFKLDIEVKSSKCQGDAGTFDRCTKISYYEKDINENVMGEIQEKGQEEHLMLAFNPDYLDQNKKMSPHYLNMTKSDEKSGEVIIEPYHGDMLPLYLKEFSVTIFRSLEAPSTTTPSVVNIGQIFVDSGKEKDFLTDDQKALIIFLQRALSFAVLSELDNMPASAFHIGVQECKNSDMSLMNTNDLLSYHSFDQATAISYVIPNYELKHDFTLEMGKLYGSYSAKDFLKEILSIDVSIDIDEKFNGQQGGKAVLKFEDVLGLLKKVFIKKYNMISMLIEILSDAEKNFENIFPKITKGQIRKAQEKSLYDQLITTQVDLPKIILSGTSQLKIAENKITIERKDVKLSAENLIAGKITFNLASLLLEKTPVVNVIYAGAKGTAEIVNSLTDSVKIDISTDRNFEDKLSEEDKAIRANAKAEARIIIFAEFKAEFAVSPAIDILSSDLGKIECKSADGKKASIKLSFAAGASFKGRVMRFYGGMDASIEISTGAEYQIKSVNRKDTEGKAYENLIDYIYFNGLTATWKLEVYSGVVVKGVKTEGKNKDESDSKSGKSGNSSIKKNFDLTTANEELKALEPINTQYENYITEKSEARVEKVRDPRYWGAGAANIGLLSYVDSIEAKKTADTMYPNHNNARYKQLQLQTQFYQENEKKFDRIKVINQEISCYLPGSEPESLMKERFQLMAELNAGRTEHGINLPAGDYYLPSNKEEFDARDNYMAKLDEKISALETERGKPEHKIMPNTKEAKAQDDRMRKAKDQYYDSKIQQLKDEKESVRNMDDVGQNPLFGARIFDGGQFNTAELAALKKELKM